MPMPYPVNTTCDIFRNNTCPPSSPAITAVPCHLEPAFEQGQANLKSALNNVHSRYTHILHVDLTVDIRDSFDAFGAVIPKKDRVYVPDSNGTGFSVSFVERPGRGTSADHLQIYLDRDLPPYPTDDL